MSWYKLCTCTIFIFTCTCISLQNQCTGADMYEFNNKSYHLRMKCFSDDVETITTEKFVPQGIYSN